MQKEVVPHKPQLGAVVEGHSEPQITEQVPMAVQVVAVVIMVLVVLEEVQRRVTPVVAQVTGMLVVVVSLEVELTIRGAVVVAQVQLAQTEPQVIRVMGVLVEQTLLLEHQ